MEVFTNKRIILPNGLLKKNFKKLTILFIILIFAQNFQAYSVNEKLLSSNEMNSPKLNNFRSFKFINKLSYNWNLLSSYRPSFLDKQKNSLANQIIINTVLKTSYCTGESATIVFEANGVYNSSNKFSVQISNFNGSFASPTVIGFINSSAIGTNNVSFKIPINMQIGNGYRIRIVSSSPVTTSLTNGVNIQITTLQIPSLAVATQIICPGASANLLATCSSGTVKWYDASEAGNVISNLTVSPAVSTDYFAACESGGICSSTRARQIVIVNKPVVLIPPNASSCLNSDLELAVVTEELNLSYAWTGPSGFTATLQNPTISNLTTAKEGVYSVRITNADNCLVTGTTSVSIGTVLQNLKVIGNTAICFSDTIKLSASSSVPAGMTYSWSGPDSYTFVGKNLARPASKFNGDGSVTYHNGLYSIVANNATTGCTGTTSLDILVATRPNIPLVLPVGNVCEGTNYEFNLALSGANFNNYNWTGPNGFTASASAVCDSTYNCANVMTTITNFSALNVGLYTLNALYVDGNSLACKLKVTKNLTIKPIPDIAITSNSTVCLGDALLFSTTFNPAITSISSFSWLGPNSFTSTIQNPVLNTTSLAGIGTYKLTAVGVNLCIGTATTFANIAESLPPLVEPTTGVVLSSSITLTASGCNTGVFNWYQSFDNQTVIMPVSPIVATSYYAKCNVSGCLSGKSGDIAVLILPPIAISMKTGSWEEKETWSIARVPLPIDSVIIRPTHYVTINSQVHAKWLAWSGFGNLIFASSGSKLSLFGVPIVVSPPELSSSPSTVYAGVSVTFTATGTGIISWYKNGINLGITGTTFTVTNPIKDDVYTAKRTLSSVNSILGNAITVIAAPPVSPPELSSSPSTVYQGISVTFTATGSGEISWFKNGVNLGITGSTYTVSNPNKDDIYTAKRTLFGVTSDVSNAITILVAPPITAPVLSSNPYTVYEGVSVTFTATGSGEISWFKNGTYLGITGSSFTVNNPVKNDVYTTKRTESGMTSGVSNAITVVASPPPPSSEVVITEPNKPPYYFSDGHPPNYYNGNLNLPAIFRNQPRYDPVNDMVWLSNNKIKIGINLKRGGQIAWASLINATTNLIYNGYDGGFQVTLDAYQRKDGYTQGGEVSGSGNPGMPTSYNVTHGGDYLNNAVSLIDYHSVPNGYYVKLRPIHYPLTAKFSQTFIEATYTIIGRSVKIEYRYTSFRTDGQWVGGGFDGAGAPACFIVNTLNKYKTFTGNSPWAFLPTQGGNLPIQNLGQNPAGAHSTEYWGMVYDSNNPNSGIGVYNATNPGSTTYFTFKQLEVYPGDGPGTEFTNGFTFFQPFIDFSITNRGNYVKDITAYLMIGSELEIRSEVYKISGHEANIPRF